MKTSKRSPLAQAQVLRETEIRLLREIARWRRSRGIDYRTGTKVNYIEWTNGTTDVVYDPSDQTIGWGARGKSFPRWIPCASVAQAVDLLVTFGLLPARFSSAYAAGWHAATVWERDCATNEEDEEFKRLFHDPRNVSFPPTEVIV